MSKINKKLKLILLGGAMFALAAVGVNLSLDRTSNWNLIMKNVNALANDEGSGNERPGYKNKDKTITQTEFKTEIDKNGVRIEYKRVCQAVMIYCESARKKNICYVDMNRIYTVSCGSWGVE